MIRGGRKASSLAFLLALLFIVGIGQVGAREKRRGLLPSPDLRQGSIDAKPGDIVEFTDSEDGIWIFTNQGKVEVYRDEIIPLDKDFTPSRVFIWLDQNRPKVTREAAAAFYQRFLLCKAIAERFPAHELAEEFAARACDNFVKSEGIRTMGKTSWEDSVGVIDDYLLRYPGGKHASRLHFKRFELKTDPYEYEGSVRLILQTIEQYQGYLVAHSDSREINAVRMKLARLYAMALESFPKSQQKERNWVRGKALKLYRKASQDGDLETRQRAKVALYNLEQGRRIYFNPNDW